ncbi:MAG: winged helix-turn-helix domain-containing protein [Methylocystis sp.]|uniref:winged helix-turn-helix domain-containing protein n=1 Tax=Methylocystis sp. TaxID=1911079 RepID=UPI003DA2A709
MIWRAPHPAEFSEVDSGTCWPADLHFAFRDLGEPRLTNAEAKIVSLLYRRAQVSHEALLATTFDYSKDDDERSIDVVKVYICNIRRKLALLGVKIETMRPGFYRFDRDAKARLRELLQAAHA